MTTSEIDLQAQPPKSFWQQAEEKPVDFIGCKLVALSGHLIERPATSRAAARFVTLSP